jgi:hypothetical protein
VHGAGRQVVRSDFRRAAGQLDRDPGYPGRQRCCGQPAVFPLGLAQQAAQVGQEGQEQRDGGQPGALFAMRPIQGPVTSYVAAIVVFYSVGAHCAERRALLGGGIGLAALAVLIAIGQHATAAATWSAPACR